MNTNRIIWILVLYVSFSIGERMHMSWDKSEIASLEASVISADTERYFDDVKLAIKKSKKEEIQERLESLRNESPLKREMWNSVFSLLPFWLIFLVSKKRE